MVVFAVVIATAAIVAGPAVGKGRAPNHRYAGYLTAAPQELRAGDFFDVYGCGYDEALGNVIVGFGGGSWGSPLGEGGCFEIKHIPVGGDNPMPGTYPVTAYQFVRNKWIATGQTTVTILPS